MKIFLVGGAVRDKLLGIPTEDRDWVVIGSNPANMIELGYRQVGKDFPVFLHPTTREQYALARTEKKTGFGHTAFDFNVSSTVTLEDDLKRRDLTINAIAEDHNGKLIDPFGGLSDIKNKLLRHVSEAFYEDPLRVLRVARFHAKLSSIGFSISPDTLRIMSEISQSGELKTLSPERIWQEFQKSLAAPSPDKFILTLKECGALKALLPEMNIALKTLNSLSFASALTKETNIRYAALIHDISKSLSDNFKQEKHLKSHEYELELQSLIKMRFNVPNDHAALAALVCEHHQKMGRLKESGADELLSIIESLDAIRRPERFERFLTVCEAISKTSSKNIDYSRTNLLSEVIKIISNIDVKELLHNQPDQQAREVIRQHRLQLINTYITEP
tara:strand:+ start:4844 stop:6010 length:1167 start_codon:yes stop_codon:yes gene_type:complete